MALTKKIWYDQPCRKCAECYHFRPAGQRGVIQSGIWPESCGLYGYSFHPERFPEVAEDCDGFVTEQDWDKARIIKEKSARISGKIKKS